MQWSMHLHSFAHIYTFAASNKHKNKKISIEYIFMVYIYIFVRLNICMYGLHVCIYSDKYSCVLTKQHLYIYIYICSVRPNSSCPIQWCYSKLQSAYIIHITESSRSYCRLLSRNISIAQAQS